MNQDADFGVLFWFETSKIIFFARNFGNFGNLMQWTKLIFFQIIITFITIRINKISNTTINGLKMAKRKMLSKIVPKAGFEPTIIALRMNEMSKLIRDLIN